jgi:hypothetical protein
MRSCSGREGLPALIRATELCCLPVASLRTFQKPQRPHRHSRLRPHHNNLYERHDQKSIQVRTERHPSFAARMALSYAGLG